MAQLLTVHDPRGYPPKVTGKRLAPRLDTLEGKLLYLVDCLFDNSEVFLRQLQAWLAEHMPGVRTQIVKPRESWVDDPALRARIVAEADAAVFAVGL
jgi:ATP-dependent phosphoenolpyruvate carboxykinase